MEDLHKLFQIKVKVIEAAAKEKKDAALTAEKEAQKQGNP